MLYNTLTNYFSKYPDILYGFATTKYSHYTDEYGYALVYAVPYGDQLALRDYREERLENTIQEARARIDGILPELERLLQAGSVNYLIPSAAQGPEDKNFQAPFSFKYAAVHAGLGWIGKNDLLVTPQYGPRVRLSAILLVEEVPISQPIMASHCPPDCDLCVKACPYHALSGARWDINIHREALIDYELCDQERSKFIEDHGRKSSCGLCLVSCPMGKLLLTR